MIDLSVSVAFLAGVISFFAPCVVPLLPAYIGYVTGVSVNDLKKSGYALYRRQIMYSSLLYIVGFSFVFVLSGAFAASIGATFRRYDLFIQQLGGLVILIMGLELSGILNIPLFARRKEFTLPKWASRLGPFRALLIGIIFATAWTPCIGPVLGSILALAVTTGEAVHGAILLFVYSLGISVPFLVVSFSLLSAPHYLKSFMKHIDAIAKVSGILLAILGMLLLTNTYRYLNSWIYSLLTLLGWNDLISNFV